MERRNVKYFNFKTECILSLYQEQQWNSKRFGVSLHSRYPMLSSGAWDVLDYTQLCISSCMKENVVIIVNSCLLPDIKYQNIIQTFMGPPICVATMIYQNWYWQNKNGMYWMIFWVRCKVFGMFLRNIYDFWCAFLVSKSMGNVEFHIYLVPFENFLSFYFLGCCIVNFRDETITLVLFILVFLISNVSILIMFLDPSSWLYPLIIIVSISMPYFVLFKEAYTSS